MPNTIALRRRIKSVKSTRQITKAMELVSASKMRRASVAAQASRPFVKAIGSTMTKISGVTDISLNPYFAKNSDPSTVTYAVFTSNRGLAGSYNTNVLKLLALNIKQDMNVGKQIQLITVGKKASNFAAKLTEVKVLASFYDIPTQPTESDMSGLLNVIIDSFDSNSSVIAVYTDYISSITQEAKKEILLPMTYRESATQAEKIDTDQLLVEPCVRAVVSKLAERLLEVKVWQMYLESQASEQSSRMLAMKTASDNAGDIIEDLTLMANTMRQASITQELSEIIGGSME
jgi:F-type H+-transporting ATPase subunit gamma